MAIRSTARCGVRLFGSAVFCATLGTAQSPAKLDAARNFLSNGDRPQAIQILSEIVKTNPQDADARILLGGALADQGRREDSLAQLREAVHLRPRSAEAEDALGEAFEQFGDDQSAREAFEKALKLDGADTHANVDLALICLKSDQFSRAGALLDIAIGKLDGSRESAYPLYLRAKAYIGQNDVESAVKELRKAVSLQPGVAAAWSDLGVARQILLDNAGALTAFERAVELDPDDGVAQYRLGAEYLHQVKPHLAVIHLEKALILNPDDQSSLYSLQLALQ